MSRGDPKEHLAAAEPTSGRSIVCKHGAAVFLRPGGLEDLQALAVMFDTFEPKESVQGLPPSNREARARWLEGLLEEPVHVVAEAEGQLVGHACLLEIEPGVRGELLIMVHQDWQNRGVGSRLLTLLAEVAHACRFRRIWLLVDSRNTRAIHVYRDNGFKLLGPALQEFEMELNLADLQSEARPVVLED